MAAHDTELWHAIGRLATILHGIGERPLVLGTTTASLSASAVTQENATSELAQLQNEEKKASTYIKELVSHIAALKKTVTAAITAKQPVDKLNEKITELETLLADERRLVTNDKSLMECIFNILKHFKVLHDLDEKRNKEIQMIETLSTQHDSLKKALESAEAAVEKDKTTINP